MKRWILIFFLMPLACSPVSEKSEERGTVFGLVSDSKTGEPIHQVHLSLPTMGLSVVTGTDGAYQFQDIPAGDYRVLIKKDGYTPVDDRFVLIPGNRWKKDFSLTRIPAVVTISTNAIDFTADESDVTRSFGIVNNSYGVLEWEAICGASWISFSPSSGKLPYTQTETIVVTLNRELLNEGDNEATVVVRTTDGGSEVRITAYRKPQPGPRNPELSQTRVTNVDLANGRVSVEATVVDEGLPALSERGFCYSTTNVNPTVDDGVIRSDGEGKGLFRGVIQEVELDRNYFVRAYARTTEGITYSSSSTPFSTEAQYPSVEMLEPTDVSLSTSGATLRGNIMDVGIPAYEEKGFLISENEVAPQYATAQHILVEGNGEGIFLHYHIFSAGKSYYIRSFSKNKKGVSLSFQVIKLDF